MLLRISLPATLLALMCLGLGAVPEAAPLLAYDRQSILSWDVWRLWTGHWVHFSTQQLLLDASTLVLAGAVAQREFGPWFITRLLLLGTPAMSIGLLLMAPDLAHYRGASGIVMMLAVAAGAAYWSGRPRLRGILVMLGLMLVAKAVWDAAGFASFGSGLPEGVQVAWQAHVLGAGIGWAAARVRLKNLQ